jgi:hypothetical protein
MRRKFGPKRDGIRESRRKLHNEELHNQYFSRNKNDQVQEDEMGMECSTHEREEKLKERFGGKPEEETCH